MLFVNLKRGLIIGMLCMVMPCFADDNLSKQATAFYSDNNHIKSMDLLLQIPIEERSAQDWLLLGNIAEDKEEYDNAFIMYKKAIEVDPKYYKAYYNLGNNSLKNGRHNMAIKYYKKALEYKKDNAYIYYNLACAYIKAGNLKKAKNALNNAIMYNSNVAEFHYNLAYVYSKLGKEKFAKTYLENYNKLAG